MVFPRCVQAFLQQFSWTQAAVPADLARRNALLAASEAATAAGEQVCYGCVVLCFGLALEAAS